ncbi:hypothetical protein [Oscillospiraceae bacterium]|nr:hypothetical protein [Oscillospiraceae bacterium]
MSGCNASIFWSHRSASVRRLLASFPPGRTKILGNPTGLPVAFACLTKNLLAQPAA